MKLGSLILLAIFLVLRVTAQPAFLDANNRVRMWVPKPTTALVVAKSARIEVAGKSINIVSAKAVTPVGDDEASVDPTMVNFPGTIQGAAGGKDWSPADASTKATETSTGVFELVLELKKGNYEYKLARGGTWAENYGRSFVAGGQNIQLDIEKDAQIVRIVADFNQRTIKDSINNSDVIAPTAAPKQTSKERSLSRVFELQLESAISPNMIAKDMWVEFSNQRRRIVAREVLSDPVYFYSKADLGATWDKSATTFKVWSPVSSKVNLRTFGVNAKCIPMKRSASGVWYLTLKGNHHGLEYVYEFTSYGLRREAPDIECKASNQNSTRSIVVDLARTNELGYKHIPLPPRKSVTDAVIYELHVRDFTVDPNSGVPSPYRGKYLGLASSNTIKPGANRITGLDYLKWLGITDIHLLPIHNFNPANSKVYNWGYETNLFNVPEEQYSTNPAKPLQTIREFKTMVNAIHSKGLRVVLDVVYNHTVPSEGPQSAFDVAVPYYYFRNDDRGRNLNESGVGNALHDDHPMVRRHVINSLKYWLEEYKIDGFRFDLLGMFSKETVSQISKELHTVRPDVLIYGEPWTGGGPLRFPKGAQKGLGVAVFNDNFRGTVRGDLDGDSTGFATGSENIDAMKRGLLGSIEEFAASPTESVNYVSAHDNMTLLDRIKNTVGGDINNQKRSLKFAGAIVLLSQGIPFIEGGSEIGRTKGENHNSYNAGDAINKFDWQRASQFQDVSDYYRGLIGLRLQLPSLRLSSKNEIQLRCSFLSDLPKAVIGYQIIQPSGKRLIVLLNGSTQQVEVTFPAGNWTTVLSGDSFAPTKSAPNVSLGALSTTVISED